jgi:hypothetical protein
VTSLKVPSSETDPIFALSFASTLYGQLKRPSVDIRSIENKGYGLVASKFIPKGSCIFTERAAVATQVPLQDGTFAVPACQWCFRSLATIQMCSEKLPRHDCWPILELCYNKITSIGNDQLLVDDFGRAKCRSCNSLFCTVYCHEQFDESLGSCCVLSRALRSIPSLLNDVQSAVALGVRIFAYGVQYYRRQGSLDGSVFDSTLCGEAEDIVPLELGLQQTSNEQSTYSLQRLFDELIQVWLITTAEQAILSCTFLHRCAAIAARNGVDLTTQSPFKQYYNSLLRASGGRGDARHEEIKRDVALAFGSERLERGMDRTIDNLVAPDLVGLFLLVGRINHDCNPNSQILSQVYLDCHLDLISLRDIQKGEEISISYIGLGRGVVGDKTQHRRRRELEAKYLFVCKCAECEE